MTDTATENAESVADYGRPAFVSRSVLVT
ncbi:MAG TPA: beta-ketoacyl-ACP reductase, partial [Mycobacterium sp.]|nr:beta-ketoacyl-ACP reductase [Mycobacterium sp.]